MELKDVLKAARLRKKMSMTEVSNESLTSKDPRGRITQGYISRLESGKEKNPSYLKLKTLCRIYGIKPGRLFDVK